MSCDVARESRRQNARHHSSAAKPVFIDHIFSENVGGRAGTATLLAPPSSFHIFGGLHTSLVPVPVQGFIVAQVARPPCQHKPKSAQEHLKWNLICGHK